MPKTESSFPGNFRLAFGYRGLDYATMRITFRVRFHTHPGQSLWITGEDKAFGAGNLPQAVPLQYLNAEFWETTLVFPGKALPATSYNYVLKQPDGSVIFDWGADKVVPTGLEVDEILIVDSWNPAAFYENAFYTEPFKEVLLTRNRPARPLQEFTSAGRTTHIFKVKAPLLTKTQTLCLLGDGPVLGHWDATTNPLLLTRKPGEEFLTVSIDLSSTRFPISYKYGVYDAEARSFVRWEDGPNRTLDDSVAQRRRTIVNDGFVRLPANTWRGAGVAIPVFSLRTEKSFGVGEFTDLKLLADWCVKVGIKLIQILPVNDTIATNTRTDSYPYAAISALALHPQYLNLERVAGGENKKLLVGLEAERQRLNALEAVDYEGVMAAKMRFLRQIFPSQKENTFRSKEYKAFFKENETWLKGYAAFSHFRDEYETADFSKWPRNETFNTTLVEGTEHLEFYFFLQFHLHLQLREAAEYAHQHGVILKGDIAIGVSRNGADAWENPKLYHMEVQAGAPPDPFAEKGQNWGFPTYNWPLMHETGFAWWKQRFVQMGAYFDAFRIDHILGFFRIWSIPLHAVEGILGYFVPALPVHVTEFAARGIPFDRQRFVEPWVTEDVLDAIFGVNAGAIKTEFLEAGRFGRYTLKPEFGTQRQVEAHFQMMPKTAAHEALKLGLFDLISNVLLFEVAGSQGRQFHFRFAIDATTSFKALDRHTQGLLKDLYVDYFFRRQDGFWMKEAMQKLPALKRSTRMLVCGEDLGLVPACVPDGMKQLGLLSLEIQRMPKDLGRPFSRPAEAPYLSVVSLGTHDMSTIRGWWGEDRALIQRFFNQELGAPGDAPAECEPWIVRAIVRQHLASPAMWTVIQLQDYLGMERDLRRPNTADERINVPGNPKNYWRYRVHLTMERLLKEDAFNEDLAKLVRESGRL
jgi:4-alpha-glucanotransferase